MATDFLTKEGMMDRSYDFIGEDMVLGRLRGIV